MKELARPGFIYTVEHLDRDGRTISVEQVHNIIPTVGCNYILGTSLLGVSAFAAWYLGLFGAARARRTIRYCRSRSRDDPMRRSCRR